MKTFEKQAAQGDLLIVRVDEIPATAKLVPPKGGQIVVAHSETGHHHAFAAIPGVEKLEEPGNAMVGYLRIAGEVNDGAGADLVHHRPHDTHETLRLPPGNYELRRQREWTPQGLRRVED